MPRPDILDWIDDKKTEEGFSRLVSGGKYGYKTIIEKRKEQPKCNKCDFLLRGSEKFCPQCGAKVEEEKKREEKS